ncbi:hypothetical protein R1sor_023016 [Riccia sorocarpa]|uniref:Uncharacterized protein n=1 Tax=Riccia sorocarpa TaxID=122646 RepID=A0ABD3GPP4_9MARC
MLRSSPNIDFFQEKSSGRDQLLIPVRLDARYLIWNPIPSPVHMLAGLTCPSKEEKYSVNCYAAISPYKRSPDDSWRKQKIHNQGIVNDGFSQNPHTFGAKATPLASSRSRQTTKWVERNFRPKAPATSEEKDQDSSTASKKENLQEQSGSVTTRFGTFQASRQLDQLNFLKQEISRKLLNQQTSYSKLADEAREATKDCQLLQELMSKKGLDKVGEPNKLNHLPLPSEEWVDIPDSQEDQEEPSGFTQDPTDAKIGALVNRLTLQKEAAAIGECFNTPKKTADFQVNLESLSPGPNVSSAKRKLRSPTEELGSDNPEQIKRRKKLFGSRKNHSSVKGPPGKQISPTTEPMAPEETGKEKIAVRSRAKLQSTMRRSKNPAPTTETITVSPQRGQAASVQK